MIVLTPGLWARAFRKALVEKKGSEEECVQNLIHFLQKQGAFRRAAPIIHAVCREIVRYNGGRWIVMETARALPENLQKKIRRMFLEHDHIEERTRADLIAGIRIVVDGEREFDGSLKHKLDSLLGEH